MEVAAANTGVDPRTMMVKPVDTPIAEITVARTGCSNNLTLRANTRIFESF
jgi:hypothetical protein